MSAYFSVDSFPGRRFLGKIRQIRNSATTLQNVVTYDAVIDVDNTDLKLRPGMTANVTVVYAEKPKVLAIANAALRFRPPPGLAPAASGEAKRSRGKGASGTDAPEAHALWVMRGATPQSVSVHTGLTDGTVTEVVDGDLNEGDPVVIESSAPDAPSTTPGAASVRRLF